MFEDFKKNVNNPEVSDEEVENLFWNWMNEKPKKEKVNEAIEILKIRSKLYKKIALVILKIVMEANIF